MSRVQNVEDAGNPSISFMCISFFVFICLPSFYLFLSIYFVLLFGVGFALLLPLLSCMLASLIQLLNPCTHTQSMHSYFFVATLRRVQQVQCFICRFHLPKSSGIMAAMPQTTPPNPPPPQLERTASGPVVPYRRRRPAGRPARLASRRR